MENRPQSQWEIIKSNNLLKRFILDAVYFFLCMGTFQVIVDYKQNDGFYLSLNHTLFLILASFVYSAGMLLIIRYQSNRSIKKFEEKKSK